nr:unnamed protein product [Callosobruchus analis]
MNSHRSALSLILSNDLGTDPIIKRFMKGIARLRPSQPRYNNTWDPQLILSFIENLPENLGIQQLSQKLVTLLALITGGRLQTISLIRLTNIVENSEELQINITDPIKTSGIGKSQPTLYIPFYREKPKLCVATVLKTYIEQTQPYRKPDQDFVFLTLRKPHRTASKQTISKWVKQTLSSAGLDTAHFKPHSTRHASSSAALRSGVSLETIFKTAGWSMQTATFAKFYNRPLAAGTDFAKAVLNMPAGS